MSGSKHKSSSHIAGITVLFKVLYCKMGFPGGSDSKEPACSTGDPGSILGREDPLEKEMVTHSSILAWEIPWADVPGGLQNIGLQRAGPD